MTTEKTPLTRPQIKEILDRHPGSRGEICEAANVGRQSLWEWLNGDLTSANIEQHATAKAHQLLEQERANS